MLNNKADIVENYILRRLAEQQEGCVELNRTELADKISCAPSQISYVLSTRFTQDKGFSVESRRGLGGYIRVTIITDPTLERNFLYDSMIKQIDEEIPFETVRNFLAELLENKFITRREAEIVAQTVFNLYHLENDKKILPVDRAKITRSMFLTLKDIN